MEMALIYVLLLLSSASLTVSLQLYSPVSTLLRNGPVPFITRLTKPAEYESKIEQYMLESKEKDVAVAQGNTDAYYAAPEVWAEQKLLEQQGRREVFDYGKGPEPERIILSSLWAAVVFGTLGRVIFQLAHGSRSLW
ncbi:hypothetical protein TL16_g07816 [Triparma laevis f. inornata]|uniref:Uncharacterized protein n=2 Tax=Triparma laevis TaxID=1534972 RepID=A0A9W6Z9N2_9STRA|nr:hypothetical protein TrLO_g14263 [Triparma laevis f. longispina]GMH78478.1 hypothetical protein TL16_g07816 [Triparma laevis f. inornata]